MNDDVYIEANEMMVACSEAIYNALLEFGGIDDDMLSIKEELIKTEIVYFVYHVTDRRLFEMLGSHKREEVLSAIEPMLANYLHGINNNRTKEDIFLDLVNRQTEYAKYEFLTEQMTDTIFFHFGQVIARNLTSENDIIIIMTVTSVVAAVMSEFMKQLGVLMAHLY